MAAWSSERPNLPFPSGTPIGWAIRPLMTCFLLTCVLVRFTRFADDMKGFNVCSVDRPRALAGPAANKMNFYVAISAWAVG